MNMLKDFPPDMNLESVSLSSPYILILLLSLSPRPRDHACHVQRPPHLSTNQRAAASVDQYSNALSIINTNSYIKPAYPLPTIPDVNECDENNGNCEKTCVNKQGTHECRCPAGTRAASGGQVCTSK